MGLRAGVALSHCPIRIHSERGTVPLFLREVVEREGVKRGERVSQSMKRWDSKMGQFERTRTLHGHSAILERMRMMEVIEKNGAPGGTRTPDLLVRSQTLYPTELRARSNKLRDFNNLGQKRQFYRIWDCDSNSQMFNHLFSEGDIF